MIASRCLIVIGIAIALLFTGCASYQLGSQSKIPFNSIYVEPVVNRSLAPQAQALLKEALVRELTANADIKVVSEPNMADVILQTRLSDYSRSRGVFSANDTQRPQSQNLNLTANVTLIKRGGGNYFEDREHSTQQEIYSVGNISNAEYQAMVPLVNDLAKRIVTDLLSVW